jgi:hypothetical protein
VGLADNSAYLDFDLDELPRLQRRKCRADRFGTPSQRRPEIGGENEERYPAICHVLLVAEVLIAGNKYLKCALFCLAKQFTVLEALPAHFLRSQDFVSGQ